jgi:spore coat protein U-like protein
MRVLGWLLALIAVAVTTPAGAAYSCAVSAAGSINFLTYDAFGPDTTASASVTLTCTHLSGGNENIPWTMTLSNGSAGTCTTRQMQRQTAPAASLNYNVYQNSTTDVWGNVGCGTYPSGTLQVNNGNPVRATTQTLRGVVPTGQIQPVGNYLDSLILTVTF